MDTLSNTHTAGHPEHHESTPSSSTSHLPSHTPSSSTTRIHSSLVSDEPTDRSSQPSIRTALPGVKFTTVNRDVLLYRPESETRVGMSALGTVIRGGVSESAGSSSSDNGIGMRDGVPPPKVILIFGFMSASNKSLARWTSHYTEKYPRATIGLIKMRPGFFFVSEREQERALQPIYDLLMAEIYNSEVVKREDAEKRGLVVHLLSNGGGFQFSILARMLARRFAPSPSTSSSSSSSSSPSTPPPPFPYLQIHDSLPGPSSLSSTSAFTHPLTALPLPHVLVSLLRTVAWPAAVMVVGTTLAVYWVANRSAGMDVAQIVDPNGKGGGAGIAFGGMRRWVRVGVPVGGGEGDISKKGGKEGDRNGLMTRLYVYSDTDTQVPSRGVESHIADVLSHLAPSRTNSDAPTRESPSRPTSFLPNSSTIPHPQVRVEKYKGTSHMSHVKADPERYWSAVRDMWGVAVGEVLGKGGARL